jgi:hypothetical protein
MDPEKSVSCKIDGMSATHAYALQVLLSAFEDAPEVSFVCSCGGQMMVRGQRGSALFFQHWPGHQCGDGAPDQI